MIYIYNIYIYINRSVDIDGGCFYLLSMTHNRRLYIYRYIFLIMNSFQLHTGKIK